MPPYHEPPEAAQPQRRRYRDAVHALVDRLHTEAEADRRRWFGLDVASPDALRADQQRHREQLAALMGWPLQAGPPRRPTVLASDHLGDDEDAAIHRLTLDVLPDHGGLPLIGLLLLPHRPGPHALCISQHGGAGTAELCSGLYARGSANYNDQSRRLVRRGFAVFAPQLMLWDIDKYGDPHDRQAINLRLMQLGSSIAAVELHALRCAIDALTARPDIRADGVGMAGLSYGGFYTLMAAALEPRIAAAFVSCIFHDGRRSGFNDMAWPDSIRRYGFAEIAALVAPRPLYVEHGRTDDIIAMDVRGTEAVAADAADYYRRAGAADRFVFHVHPGWHETDPADDWLAFLARQLNP